MDSESYEKSIEALTLISKAITSDQYLEDILRLIVIVTAQVMGTKVCSLWLLDDKTNSLTIRATQSLNSEYLKERSLKVGEGVVGMVAQQNRPYMALNVLEDPLFKEKDLARKMGLVSILSVPMSIRDRVVGVINCYTSEPARLHRNRAEHLYHCGQPGRRGDCQHRTHGQNQGHPGRTGNPETGGTGQGSPASPPEPVRRPGFSLDSKKKHGLPKIHAGNRRSRSAFRRNLTRRISSSPDPFIRLTF